jgi:ABC-2 type transport system permease protein
VLVDAEHNRDRKVTTLLRSSADSWLSDSNDVVPDYPRYPGLGFATGDTTDAQPLAVMLEGRFDSAFKGQRSPLLADGSHGTKTFTLTGVIDRSPGSARLIVVGSPALFSDQVITLLGEAQGTRYLKPVEFAQNMVDWSLQDQGLLAIRSRDHFARTLEPLSRGAKQFWEYLNYALALFGLGLVYLLSHWHRRRVRARHLAWLQEAR